MEGLAGVHEGYVVDRNDPEGLWRVRVRVPGLIEPASAWAFPFGTFGGGTSQRGGFRVPDLNAEVAVLFIDGDPDRPIYAPAWWGISEENVSEMPTPVTELDDPSEAKDIAVMVETARYIVFLDERSGKEMLILRDKISGDLIQMDSSGPGILIHGTALVRITSDGLLDLDAPVMQFKGRLVLPGNKPI